MRNFQPNLNNQRERFIKVFNDTESFIKENKTLSEAVENTKLHTSIHKKLPEKYLEVVRFPNNRYNYENVYVTDNKTFETAFEQVERYPNKRIAVLNFASATTLGGGVKTGASAQEECLC